VAYQKKDVTLPFFHPEVRVIAFFFFEIFAATSLLLHP